MLVFGDLGLIMFLFSGIVLQELLFGGLLVVEGRTTWTTVEDDDIVEDALDAFDDVSESRLMSGSPSPKLFSSAFSSPNIASKSWSSVSSRLIKLQKYYLDYTTEKKIDAKWNKKYYKIGLTLKKNKLPIAIWVKSRRINSWRWHSSHMNGC